MQSGGPVMRPEEKRILMDDWITGLPTDEPNALTELLGRGLPKWPGLVVVGEKVTEAQAAEIIIRTDSAVLHGPSGNDWEWVRAIGGAMGLTVPPGDGYWLPDWREVERVRKSVRGLDLEYLTNDQVSSAYVGGPKGWCAWDGTIGCNTFNVGKWPSCEDVYREWAAIAEAFPFLSLRAQLMSGESCQDDICPVIEYRVEGGTVSVRDPGGVPLRDMEWDLNERALMARILLPGGERGCSLRQFREAFGAAKAKVAEPETDYE